MVILRSHYLGHLETYDNGDRKVIIHYTVLYENLKDIILFNIPRELLFTLGYSKPKVSVFHELYDTKILSIKNIGNNLIAELRTDDIDSIKYGEYKDSIDVHINYKRRKTNKYFDENILQSKLKPGMINGGQYMNDFCTRMSLILPSLFTCVYFIRFIRKKFKR